MNTTNNTKSNATTTKTNTTTTTKTKSNVKSNNASKKANAAKRSGPGRPRYTPIIPKGKFTFADFATANGVNLKTGKGDKCTVLTLRKWMNYDSRKRNKSQIVMLKNVLGESVNEKGLGRKPFMFQRRSQVAATDTAKVEKVVSITPTAPATTETKQSVPEQQKSVDVAPVTSDTTTTATPVAA